MIDPTTGDYTDYATFTASVAKFDLNSDGPDYKLSEDFTKYSTILHLPGGINHAGWVDRNGVATDVNANVPKLTAFGYASPDFYDVGFNRAGNFYYSDYDPNNTGAPEIFEVPAGSNEGGQPVRDRAPIGVNRQRGPPRPWFLSRDCVIGERAHFISFSRLLASTFSH